VRHSKLLRNRHFLTISAAEAHFGEPYDRHSRHYRPRNS
jgi:hypothetical protein